MGFKVAVAVEELYLCTDTAFLPPVCKHFLMPIRQVGSNVSAESPNMTANCKATHEPCTLARNKAKPVCSKYVLHDPATCNLGEFLTVTYYSTNEYLYTNIPTQWPEQQQQTLCHLTAFKESGQSVAISSMHDSGVIFFLVYWLSQFGHDLIDWLQNGSTKMPGSVY